ncbi:uncharacterized protein [Eurosta solidaginis]|uniref:uncharacterized protein n=1 Tax=Eurosta solidaginis TaxID=178769 RepID=UPI00353066AA
MAKNNDDGFRTILKLSHRDLNDKNNAQAIYFSRPAIQAMYQKSKTEEVFDDLVRLKYLKLPKPTSYPLDLAQGFEQYIFLQEMSQAFLLKLVVKFLLETENRLIPRNTTEKVETSKTDKSLEPQVPKVGKSILPPKRKLVLTHWGVLSRAMVEPYRRPGWPKEVSTFYGIKYCGVLHIIDSKVFADREKHQTYHGKFEQICFSDDPDLEPITNVPVDRNDATFGIFRSTLKEFDLIYSAQINGVISEKKIDVNNLDEVNECNFVTTKLLCATSDSFLKHPKCLYFWAQLYLTNTSDICIGIRKRNDEFLRDPPKLLKVKDLPKDQKWKPVVCLRFLNTVLNMIEKTMSKVDCPYTVYEFKYDFHAKCFKSKIHHGKTDLSFLPENYIEHCKRQQQQQKQ